jgi:rhodanese-related sulfurtransferase
MTQITPLQLQGWLNDASRDKPRLLDVREPWEFQICNLPDSVSIPMQTVPARLAELDPEVDTVVICHHGVRSYQVAVFLERAGFSRLHNLAGGVAAWARDVQTSMPVY